ncbi:patatin-like phospholipase family protein [Plasticicumulans acidivorans]|uniref:NTE family protein n=1 Tax=Plasticicumulans acidivorans TaxID=886464 RepID=A0A317MXP0_9GAMM|nr:patatin-like phospholipase family protein [Plasticicumulans acidivorans]PWV63397.1 NTE family protein [Plasticicumulans acidivorans]
MDALKEATDKLFSWWWLTPWKAPDTEPAKTKPRVRRKTEGIQLGLALQGGGSHGAYTWGVLDRLLEEPRIDISAISGASAGAMNAVVCAQGLALGGRKRAQQALAEFWTAVSEAARSVSMPWDSLTGLGEGEVSPSMRSLLALTRVFSPYELNPLNINPLRQVVEEHIDFDALRKPACPRLFISATRVRTGSLRVFRNDEINADALLASACLPTLHHAVEIDGEPYWDGGYSGNPVVYPLVDEGHCSDIMVLLLSPLERDTPVRSAKEIISRASEISFNAGFLREMQWLARDERDGRLPQTHFHLLEPDPVIEELSQVSKLNAEREFLEKLHEHGHAAADAWLGQHRKDLGTRSSVSLATVFGTA